MAGWSRHEGQAIALPLENIDTDQLIPARFMSAPRDEGYGSFLLHDLRRGSDGELDPAFPLNRHGGASVLVIGSNFGSGSSREAAVYALVDAGIRAVVAPSFGDTFAGNAVNNGLLPARVDAAQAEALLQVLAGDAVPTVVDLADRTLRINGMVAQFTLEDSWRDKLINGWDDIDLTLQHMSAIAAFRRQRETTAGWALRHADTTNTHR